MQTGLDNLYTKVNDIESRVSSNIIGSVVNLSSYTSTYYTFSNDGYIKLCGSVSPGSGVTGRLYGPSSITISIYLILTM